MKCGIVISVMVVVGLVCTAAYADGCENLDDNPRWVQLFHELSDQIEAKDNDAALETASRLADICEESPILNYATGRIYRNMGNPAKELYYLQRATLFTEKFSVQGDTLEILWFERYEAEHPECKKSDVTRRTIEDLNKQVLEAQKQKYEAQIATERETYDQADKFKAVMWSGVAVGAAGLAMVTAGTVLVVLNKDQAVDVDYEKHETKTKPIWAASWGLIGGGIAATVAGAAMAGFGGYYYVRTRNHNDAVSFMIAPNQISLSYTF